MTDGSFVDDGSLSPDAAFSLLGNETRMAILRSLWEAQDRRFDGSSAVEFTDLYRRVGATDSGQFNYHLDRLTEHFVRRTAEGYELREAGNHVIRAVLAGAISDRPSFDPVEIEARCPFCGSTIEIEYTDDRLTARCTDCVGVVGGEYPRGTFLSYSFPPAGLEGRSLEAVLECAHVLYDSKITPMLEGVCPECAGAVGVSVTVCEDHDAIEGELCTTCDSAHEIWAEYVCETCKYARKCLVWFKLMNQPVVISFYYEHGTIEESIPFKKLTWESRPYVKDISEEVLTTEPLRIRVTIPYAGEELRVTVDEELRIVDTVRM